MISATINAFVKWILCVAFFTAGGMFSFLMGLVKVIRLSDFGVVVSFSRLLCFCGTVFIEFDAMINLEWFFVVLSLTVPFSLTVCDLFQGNDQFVLNPRLWYLLLTVHPWETNTITNVKIILRRVKENIHNFSWTVIEQWNKFLHFSVKSNVGFCDFP